MGNALKLVVGKQYCKQTSFLISALSCFLKWVSKVTEN